MTCVLVVDDDADLRELLVTRLQEHGYEVLSAADGETGLAAATVTVPDAVLLDWMLPGISGLQVCSALRRHPGMERTVILMLTANARRRDVVRGMYAGADDYIVKPISPRGLIAHLEAALQGR